MRIACIGRAAEQGCLYAGVINDLHRSAGRSGVGTVMASKNLKAVAVRGSNGVGNIRDFPAVMHATKRAKQVLSEDGVIGVYSCWTLADAAHKKQGAKVVLMGAGFIGCIILEALAKSGADLSVIEMCDRIVPRMMNEKAGTLIKQW